MIALGDAIKATTPHYHRYLIISDPQSNDGMVVMVTITSADGTWDKDDECVLAPEEWPELIKSSVVEFSTCRCGKCSPELQRAIDRGEFNRIRKPSLDVVRKVITAARKSKKMPDIAKEYLAQI